MIENVINTQLTAIFGAGFLDQEFNTTQVKDLAVELNDLAVDVDSNEEFRDDLKEFLEDYAD